MFYYGASNNKNIFAYIQDTGEVLLQIGVGLSVLWYPFKIWMPKKNSFANFRHPVPKSWLRPCSSYCLHNSQDQGPSQEFHNRVSKLGFREYRVSEITE